MKQTNKPFRRSVLGLTKPVCRRVEGLSTIRGGLAWIRCITGSGVSPGTPVCSLLSHNTVHSPQLSTYIGWDCDTEGIVHNRYVTYRTLWQYRVHYTKGVVHNGYDTSDPVPYRDRDTKGGPYFHRVKRYVFIKHMHEFKLIPTVVKTAVSFTYVCHQKQHEQISIKSHRKTKHSGNNYCMQKKIEQTQINSFSLNIITYLTRYPKYKINIGNKLCKTNPLLRRNCGDHNTGIDVMSD